MAREETQFKPAAEQAEPGEISVSDAAKLLGRSTVAIRQQIQAGKLSAQKRGRVYFIKIKDLDLIRNLQGGFPKGEKREGRRGRKLED